ncbi:ATP-binding cassette domain-containing protein [Tenuibacillus multivorans]|uniref:ABC-2 type transport system ATP-binding protein n=1 Tax=Tenuibacillus multivorans TaxID=237069 RepID=A0A1G9YHU8_9BACI|nr:ABC transporter ATP-binding protein [Tenuibacillus multivorans]GEL78497.1 multidrug ABC transporter ATP-binding protein [Tenuibacillus multivorans]SDN08759.1 ABC-2 type transport system ATP-binding protein [Tenuibacillus multivorans]
MLKIKDVSVSFKDHTVLDQLSLTAYEGEIIGLAAPNGTGKTTLFNVIANYLKPNEGTVVFNDQYEYKSEKDEVDIYKQLTPFPDQGDLFEELSGVDHLKLYANMWKGTSKHIKDIIKELNMESYVKNKVKTYSLGMRQRLCFGMMAAADSSIMLMDEVMNGLDVSNVALISEKLIEMKNNQKLMFVASHLLENLDLYADRVLFLKDGKIIHEHHIHDNHDTFIKVSLDPNRYNEFKQTYDLPEDHHYISDRLLCIPFSKLTLSEQTTWLERVIQFDEREFEIGTLGTLEYYEKYYHDSYIRK